MRKDTGKKNVLGRFKVCNYTLFNISKTGQAKHLCWDFLRFVNILFLIFEKEDNQKLSKSSLRFVSILLLIFEKADKLKNSARFF